MLETHAFHTWTISASGHCTLLFHHRRRSPFCSKQFSDYLLYFPEDQIILRGDREVLLKKQFLC